MTTTTTPQSAAQPQSLSVFARYAIISIDRKNTTHAERTGAAKVLMGELDRIRRKVEHLAEEHKMRAEDVRPQQLLEIDELLTEWSDATRGHRCPGCVYSPVAVLQQLTEEKDCKARDKMAALNVLLKYRAVAELVEELTK